MSALPREDELVTKDFLRAELAEFRADLRGELGQLRTGIEGRLSRVESDIWWVRWIITGGVGLYVLRSVLEWLR